MAGVHSTWERVVRKAGTALCILGLLFLMAPIVVVIPLSFSSESLFSYPIRGFSVRWYEAVLQSEAWQRAFRNSIVVALVTTVLATGLGVAAAVGLNGLRPRWRSVLVGALISPLIVPGVVIALGLFLFFSPLGLTSSMVGIVVAHTILGIPFVVVTFSAALLSFDGNLMRAAASLGADPFTAYRRVMLPLMLPALVAAALFAFVTSFDEFIVVSFLAGPEQFTLPLQMWAGAHDDVNPTILAASTLFVCTTIFLLVAVELLRRRTERLAGGKQLNRPPTL